MSEKEMVVEEGRGREGLCMVFLFYFFCIALWEVLKGKKKI